MPQRLKLACAQVHTLSTTAETLKALEDTVKKAQAQGVDVILFPEAYIGGYPRSCDFGTTIGSRDARGREQFLHHFNDAVDLGDTPAGAGQDWVDKNLEVARGREYRGDGTREELERIARESGVFVVTGVVERCAGSLYCGVLYLCPRSGALGKRRKVMPTGSERLVWAQGSASTLRAVTTVIKGVRLCIGSAVCWENYMPLLRQSLYSQNVNLYCAPTADARDTWGGLIRTIGCEGRCFVMSANQCIKNKHLPPWVGEKGNESYNSVLQSEFRPKVETFDLETQRRNGRRRSIFTQTEEGHEICLPIMEAQVDMAEETRSVKKDSSGVQPSMRLGSSKNADENAFACRGGSMIVSPFGDVLSGPLWEQENELLIQEVDFEDCERGRLDFDVGGSYSRMDSFKFSVEGLNLAPPPF